MWQRLPPGIEEDQLAVVASPQREAAFMNQAMVKRAERDEIIQARLAAMKPVFHVMAVDEPSPAASGKPTTPVTNQERAPYCGRDDPRLAADIQDITARVLRNGDQRGVAAQAAERLGRDARAILETGVQGAVWDK